MGSGRVLSVIPLRVTAAARARGGHGRRRPRARSSSGRGRGGARSGLPGALRTAISLGIAAVIVVFEMRPLGARRAARLRLWRRWPRRCNSSRRGAICTGTAAYRVFRFSAFQSGAFVWRRPSPSIARAHQAASDAERSGYRRVFGLSLVELIGTERRCSINSSSHGGV